MEVKLKNGILSDQWLSLLDELNIGAFTVNLSGKITSMNIAAQGLMGLKEYEVIGRDCREIFTGVPCLVNCILRKEYECGIDEPDVEIRDESNKKHLLTRLATPIYDPDQNVAGCMTILQDHSPIIDLIDRIYYEERSLKNILDNIDEAVFTLSRGGHITFFNSEAERISGYDRAEVLGKHYTFIFTEDTLQEFEQAKDSVGKRRARDTRNLKITTKHGDIVPVRTTYLALRNEKGIIVGGLATFHDLTLVHQLNQVIQDKYTFHDMIGKDPAMQKIFETVSIVSKTDATVLIEGATGTGKDLLAKVIHSGSKRSNKPFVKVNCAALPENLLESEMFGYVKGAFTGAERDKPGRFSEANGGTIFLDEIGDIPLALQAKLLRVLESREFYPLGSRGIKKVDVRIISATNRGLEQLVKKGLFREDLFYRLNVFRIELPILKSRRSDIPLLIPHILRRLCAAKGMKRVNISESAMELLLNYPYPGNIRELENILEHALIICKEKMIEPKHLPSYLQQVDGISDLESNDRPVVVNFSEHGERRKIIQTLRSNEGNRNKTAIALGIDRSTLWRKMKRYGIKM